MASGAAVPAALLVGLVGIGVLELALGALVSELAIGGQSWDAGLVRPALQGSARLAYLDPFHRLAHGQQVAVATVAAVPLDDPHAAFVIHAGIAGPIIWTA